MSPTGSTASCVASLGASGSFGRLRRRVFEAERAVEVELAREG